MKLKPIKCQPFIVKNFPFNFGFNKGYFLEYEVVVYENLFTHSECFKTADNMKEFCEANGISREELKKVWTKEMKVIELWILKS